MKNKIKKIIVYISILAIVLSIGISDFSKVFATGLDQGKPEEFEQSSVDSNVSDKINKVAGTAVTLVRVIGSAISIVMLITLAMKYMISSAGDRADIKKHATVYVVGAIVLFAAVNIIGILANFAEKVFNTTTTTTTTTPFTAV